MPSDRPTVVPSDRPSGAPHEAPGDIQFEDVTWPSPDAPPAVEPAFVPLTDVEIRPSAPSAYRLAGDGAHTTPTGDGASRVAPGPVRPAVTAVEVAVFEEAAPAFRIEFEPPSPDHGGDPASGRDATPTVHAAGDAYTPGAMLPARIAPTTGLIPLPAGAPPPVLPPPPPPGAPRAEARRAWRDRLRMLRRHAGWLVAGVLVGAGIGYLIHVLTPPRYEAYGILLVTSPAEGPQGAVAGGFATAPGRDASRTLNQALILQQAPVIARQTADRLLARTDAEGLSVVRAASIGETPVTAARLAAHLQESVVTVAPQGENVDAIRVSATAEDPREAALIASLFTDFYQQLSRGTNRARAEETVALLDTQIAEMQDRLASVEAGLSGYMTRENAAALDEQARTTVAGIGQLQSQLDAARATARTQAARLAQLERDLASVPRRLGASAEAAVTTSPVETTALDTQISDLERLVENVYQRNPDLRANPYAHPDLQAMLTRLEGLRAERRRLSARQAEAAVASGGLDVGAGASGASYVASLQQQISATRAELEGARAQEALLSGRLGEQRGSLRAVPRRQTDIAQMERERATLAEALAEMQRERHTSGLAAATELGVTQLVREVQVPESPSGPGLPMSTGSGGALGLLLALGLVAFRHRTDARAHTPDDLAEAGFSVVATLPDVSAVLREGRVPVGPASVHPALVTLSRPLGAAAEGFRHLHAGLLAAGAPGQPPVQVVLVASPEIGSGKSFIAANLAVAAAQAGRRVLLVDADLRKPSVPDLLGLDDLPPLGEGPPETNLVYWSTPVAGLFAMTPRERAERAEQLWAPHVVGALLANLRGAFDLIVLDAPPALVAADAALLAPHADAAVLVARAGKTDLDAMAHVAGELSRAGLTRIGAVLNRFDARHAVGYRATAGVRHSTART